MKRILYILLSISLIASSGFARAGKSYSRSSSHSSSSSSSYSRSYSKPTSNYQRSYARPVYTAPRPTPVMQRSTVTKNVTINKTTNVTHTNNRNNNGNDGGSNGGNNGGGSGMGIGGTIMGVAGGIVAGNLLTSALMGDHRNAGYAPAGGYHEVAPGIPAAGQPVAPAMAGATEGSYVTDGKGGFVETPTTQASVQTVEPTQTGTTVTTAQVIESEPECIWSKWYMWIIYGLTGAIVVMAIMKLYPRWKVARERKIELQEMIESENNLQLFKSIFLKVQQSYSTGSNISLINLTTKEIYDYIQLSKSNTEDEGLTNVVEDVSVLSITNIDTFEIDGVKYQKCKIRFSMIDYTEDSSGKVYHGSKETQEKAVEYWTFKSNSKNYWVLCEIQQHNGYVHQ